MADFITATLNALFDLEREVSDQLNFYGWQPRKRPTRDGLWNWISPDEAESDWPDPSKHRDVFVVTVSIAVAESADPQGQVDRLLAYTDQFVNLVDPALHAADSRPWLIFDEGACGVYAVRQRFHTALYQFGPNDPPVLAMDFPIRVQLDRTANSFG